MRKGHDGREKKIEFVCCGPVENKQSALSVSVSLWWPIFAHFRQNHDFQKIVMKIGHEISSN